MDSKENQYHPQIAFHPGETLAEKLEELGMGPKEFAIRAGKPEKTVIAVMKGKSSVTPTMAVQFEHVLKIPAHFWLNMQRNFDEFVAREKRQELLAESIEWANLFPISEMIDQNWLPNKSTNEERTSELLTFFGFSNHKAWEEYYIKQQLKVAFSISLLNTKEPYTISAWLRQGELQVAELPTNPYDEKAFKSALRKIPKLMATHSDNGFSLLQELCLSTGVKLVCTPCLTKVQINGSTRWLNQTPLIQLSANDTSKPSFWTSFLHQVGHVILHGKKEIFLEDIDYLEKDKQKEEEADRFATKWLLPVDEHQENFAA